MALLKLCQCGKKITAADKRCEPCQIIYDKQQKQRHKTYDATKRDKKAAAFYTSKPWSVTRNKIAERDHYLCKLCLSNKRFKPMQLVHHIQEYKDHPHLALVESNLISLCARCHHHVHKEYEINKREMQRALQKLVGG